jgi:ADP-ribosyl-[dinitrogen reductase] hydrolase
MTASSIPTPAIRAALLGLAVGDALGVPVEFSSRAARRQDPVLGMRAYGTHHQPAGTWSDDASLTFCLAESLCRGYDVRDAARRFLRWYDEGYWTAYGQVFDVGVATAAALRRLRQGTEPSAAGGRGEADNGNGSLMRILPLVFDVQNLPVTERFERTRAMSAITHGHIRSVLGCFIYVEMARQLLLRKPDKAAAYQAMQQEVNGFLRHTEAVPAAEVNRFHRILENEFGDYELRPLTSYQEDEINGSGYVLHTLEAALWCLLRHDTYADTVLAAVNLGDDTDTTGAVAGGLAGLAYGEAAIPAEWLTVLARRADIEDLALRLAGATAKASGGSD